IRKFWQVRDPFPQTAVNEFQERWEARARTAREKFGNLTEDRARMMLWNGEPAHVLQSHCSEVFLPLEIWTYDKNDFIRTGYSLAFYQPAGSTWRLWYPSEGVSALLAFDVRARFPNGINPQTIETSCPQGGDIMSAASNALDWSRVESTVPLAPKPN